MNRHAETKDSSSPPVETPTASERERSRRAPSFGELHGRILQVSRLATIGEMAAGIAHELNQPLTAIANYAQACDRLLGRAGTDQDDARAALREIAGQAVRAGDILSRLRSLAQAQTMKRQATDINLALEEIRDLMLADGHAHGAEVRFEFGTHLPRVVMDAAQIQHVILNLVRNGLEALEAEEPSSRMLRVRTEVTRDVSISDLRRKRAPRSISEPAHAATERQTRLQERRVVRDPSARRRKVPYNVTANVVWLTSPASDRDCRHIDPINSLKQSVARVAAEVERSGRLKAEIAAAVDARRYPLYGRSMTLGTRASERSLAASQRIHVGNLLSFVHAIAAAGSSHRAGKSESAARLDPLTASIRELEAILERARRLSRDVLAECQRRDWGEGTSPLGGLQH